MSSVQHSPVILAVEVPALPSCTLAKELVLTPVRVVTYTVQEYNPNIVCELIITRVMSGYELLI